MKNIFLLTLFISFSGFSQQLTYKTGGSVYNSENQKIKPAAVRELMKDNPAALNLYNVGRQKKTWGNVLFYGGIGLAAINLATAVYTGGYTVNSSGEYTDEKSSFGLAIAGGVMVVASIPIKIGYTKKVKKAIGEYNEGLVYQEKFTPDVTLLANASGLGFRIQF
jgi:NADPH:quinone reductase-like Zn-dependent oxidoreductase